MRFAIKIICHQFKVCQYLHLCPSTGSVEPVQPALREDPKCTVCVYLVNAIDDAIEDPSDVEKVSSLVPTSKYFIDQPETIKLVIL